MKYNISTLKNALAFAQKGEVTNCFKLLQDHHVLEHDTELMALKARWSTWNKDNHKGVLPVYDNEAIKIMDSLINRIVMLKDELLLPIAHHFPILSARLLDNDHYLIGRKDAQEKIEATFSQNHHIVVIHGIGGIGKTTTALAFGNSQYAKEKMVYRFWVEVLESRQNDNPQSNALIESIISQFHETLQLTGNDTQQQLDTITDYLHSLGNDVLLVLDNANNPTDLQKMIKLLRNFNIKVLITSRSKLQGVESVTLEKLSFSAAMQLFTLHHNIGYIEADVTPLFDALQYHPLLIELCAKQLENDSEMQLQPLIAAAQKADLSCLTADNIMIRQDEYLEKSIATFLIDIFPLHSLTEAEKQVLRYFALLSQRPYTLTDLKKVCVLPDKISTTETPAKILTNLAKLGWLEESNTLNKGIKTTYYNCHPLIRYAITQQLQPDAQNCEPYFEALWSITQYIAGENYLTQVQWLPDVLTALSYLTEENTLKIKTYDSIRYLYKSLGNYQQALVYGKKCVSLVEILYAEKDNLLATAYNNIAGTYMYLGDYQQALIFYQKAIEIQEAILDKNHPDLAGSYNNIAMTYRNLGNYQQALAYYQKSMNILEAILDKNHPHLATSYNNIAAAYMYLGNYQQALTYSQKAIEIREATLDKNHPDLATSYNNIALIYRNLGNYQQALTYYQKAIEILEATLDKNHPHLAIFYNNISDTYQTIKDFENALLFAKKSLMIVKANDMTQHPQYKDHLNRMKRLLIIAKSQVNDDTLREYWEWVEGF